jgi:hypothetical protein
MSDTANYLIAQHVADVFRREPKNVGVFVRLGAKVQARFFGEGEAGTIDARKLRVLPAPDTYTQWVQYWRRILEKRPDSAWDEIQKTATGHYQIIDGGMVDAIGDDAIEDVVGYLYSALVSEGGIAAALGAPDETEAAVRLADAVAIELKKQSLLMDERNELFKTRHLVRTNIPVEGTVATHILSFVQQNGHNVVMEPIDLAVRRDKKRMTERAGWASRVFGDIRHKKPTTEAIALISATAEEEKDDSAIYALKLLRPSASDVINWQSAADRKRFIDARARLAESNPKRDS